MSKLRVIFFRIEYRRTLFLTEPHRMILQVEPLRVTFSNDHPRTTFLNESPSHDIFETNPFARHVNECYILCYRTNAVPNVILHQQTTIIERDEILLSHISFTCPKPEGTIRSYCYWSSPSVA